MEPVSQLLTLPLDTLAVLAFGYIGYRIAFVGHDGPHRPIDTVFSTTIFAFLAKAAMIFHGPPSVLAAFPAFGSVFVAALLWRMWLAPMMQTSFRNRGIIDHDRGRSVWETMLMRKLNCPTQMVVDLKDGSSLMCDDLNRFKSDPLGPCLLGPDGSVAIYVTSHRNDNADEFTPHDDRYISDPTWGSMMTFIPASEIAQVRMRRTNPSVAAAAAAARKAGWLEKAACCLRRG